MIGIVDYGAGNLKSVENALLFLGAEWKVVSAGDEIWETDGLILPGVGSFGDAMAELDRRGLTAPLKAYAISGKPFLGICLGLQLLFEYSEESPGVPGLGIFRGGFKRIPSDLGLKVPHIGWNSLEIIKKDGIFKGTDNKVFTYFVHSFYLDAADKAVVAATTCYGVKIDAAVERGNVSACQFHPEKSGENGLKILNEFILRCRRFEREGN